jgi:cytochrome c
LARWIKRITGSFDSHRDRLVARDRGGTAGAPPQRPGESGAALPGGRWASGGEDGRIAVWAAGEDTPALILEGHTAPVVGLAVSPDGETIASASWDATVRLWPSGGGAARVLTGHSANVNAVAFTADGTLVSAGYDSKLIVWPAAEGAAARTVTLPTPLNTLAALPGGRIAVGGADGRLRVLDIEGQVLVEAAVVETPVIGLAASPDGKLLAAAGLRGAIAVLDAVTLRPVHLLVGPGLPVWSLAFTTDGRFLLTGGADRLVRRWDVATGEHVGAIVSGPPDALAEHAGDRGAEVFRACVACHTLSPGESERAGPTLHGIFGRRIASVPGYNYSAAFREMDLVWTPDTVSKLFEVGPAAFTPGTKMPQQTIGNPEDRAALMRFLEKATAAQP